MRILFLSPRQCWPARSGARLREYHFARALARHAEVTYLHFSDPGTPPLTRSDLPFLTDVLAVPKPPTYGTGKTLRGLLGRWPLPILNYTSPEMTAAVDRLTREGSFDLIHLDSIHMIRYGELVARGPDRDRGARLVYNWHNIESEAMRRYASAVPSRARRWYAGHTASRLEALERGILRTAFGHIVCSEREREQLRQVVPQARIAVVENGVDAGYFAGANSSGSANRSVVFIGAMDYFPNVQAATSFAGNIWPHIRGRFPDIEFLIVGSNPVPAVQSLGELPGITVTGTVPDVRPYYRDALAAVVPLRSGGGTRLKILEAMAAGVPVISTPLGAEGLAVTAGREIIMAGADDVEAWIRSLSELSESPGRREQIAAAARDLVRSRYDWNILGGILNKTYSNWLRADS